MWKKLLALVATHKCSPQEFIVLLKSVQHVDDLMRGDHDADSL